jgi:hypothetical protein
MTPEQPSAQPDPDALRLRQIDAMLEGETADDTLLQLLRRQTPQPRPQHAAALKQTLLAAWQQDQEMRKRTAYANLPERKTIVTTSTALHAKPKRSAKAARHLPWAAAVTLVVGVMGFVMAAQFNRMPPHEMAAVQEGLRETATAIVQEATASASPFMPTTPTSEPPGIGFGPVEPSAVYMLITPTPLPMMSLTYRMPKERLLPLDASAELAAGVKVALYAAVTRYQPGVPADEWGTMPLRVAQPVGVAAADGADWEVTVPMEAAWLVNWLYEQGAAFYYGPVESNDS